MNLTSVANALKENEAEAPVIKPQFSASFSVGARSILRLSPIVLNARYKPLYVAESSQIQSFILTTGEVIMAWLISVIKSIIGYTMEVMNLQTVKAILMELNPFGPLLKEDL